MLASCALFGAAAAPGAEPAAKGAEAPAPEAAAEIASARAADNAAINRDSRGVISKSEDELPRDEARGGKLPIVAGEEGDAAPPSQQAAGTKPDIALIIADDMMRLSLAPYANNSLLTGLTPNLNAMAARSGAVAVQRHGQSVSIGTA